ncbi:hypothetical protein ED312_16580 [Sinomicrobium pectinilyticum]|uniref:Uncharacterized protein n=1 Tax=Sinomicrobium pectinilyticum TaxID=1084421 RepID=A0A3N0E4J0_SINP1|nr:hypothetical protein ED312_16580 [Sinomicrobium pectinilyticum]
MRYFFIRIFRISSVRKKENIVLVKMLMGMTLIIKAPSDFRFVIFYPFFGKNEKNTSPVLSVSNL